MFCHQVRFNPAWTATESKNIDVVHENIYFNTCMVLTNALTRLGMHRHVCALLVPFESKSGTLVIFELEPY